MTDTQLFDMGRAKYFRLADAGSVTYQDDDGRWQRIEQGHAPITKTDLKKLPERQQKLFERCQEDGSPLEETAGDE